MRRLTLALAVTALLAPGAAAAEPRWRDEVRLGPVQGDISMASDARGRVLVAWRSHEAIRWRFAQSGLRGRIPTPAPGAPAAALDARGGAVLAWGEPGDFDEGTRGSISFAARTPGRKAFKTTRRETGADDELYGPPALALAPSGLAAWAWEGFLGVPSIGIGTVPYAASPLHTIPSRQLPADVSLGWLDEGRWLATWLVWSGRRRAGLVAGEGGDTVSLLRNRRRWLTLPAPPEFDPECLRVAIAPSGALLAAWDDQRPRRGSHQRRIMVAGLQPDGTTIAPRAVTSWNRRGGCPAVAMASDGWGAVAWLAGRSGNGRVRVAISPPGGTLGPARTIAHDENANSVDVSVARGGGVLAVWAGSRRVRAAMSGRRPRTLAAGGIHPRAILRPDGTATVTWRVDGVAWMARRR